MEKGFGNVGSSFLKRRSGVWIVADVEHGVFATRSPYRPNPIGLTVVELIESDGPRPRVRGINMLDGTPILDIKPYLSSVPAETLRRGWLDEVAARPSQPSRGCGE